MEFELIPSHWNACFIPDNACALHHWRVGCRDAIPCFFLDNVINGWPHSRKGENYIPIAVFISMP